MTAGEENARFNTWRSDDQCMKQVAFPFHLIMIDACLIRRWILQIVDGFAEISTGESPAGCISSALRSAVQSFTEVKALDSPDTAPAS